MTETAHLWAIGYDDMKRADQVRDKITQLGWGPGHAGKDLLLLEIAVVVHHPDGTFTFDRKPVPGVANILGWTTAGFLAGLVLAAPLTGATIGALVGGAGTAAAAHTGISEDFIRDVKAMMRKPTTNSSPPETRCRRRSLPFSAKRAVRIWRMLLARSKGPNTSREVNSRNVAAPAPARPKSRSSTPRARNHFPRVRCSTACGEVKSSVMAISSKGPCYLSLVSAEAAARVD